MRSARFGATHRGQPLGHLQGKPKEGREADNPPALAPAGEIHMSLQDWAKFAIDQMQGDLGQGKLLKPASYKMLHDAAREGGKFGLGWRRQPTMAGMTGPFLSHSGSNECWFAAGSRSLHCARPLWMVPWCWPMPVRTPRPTPRSPTWSNRSSRPFRLCPERPGTSNFGKYGGQCRKHC